jgi:CBS domain-containing protein
MTSIDRQHLDARMGDLRELPIADLMHSGLVSCQKGTTAAELARIMTTCRVHSVIVMGVSRAQRDEPSIWGSVSDLDVLDAVLAGDEATTAEHLAKEPVIRIRVTKSVYEAAEAMVGYRARHLIVVDSDGQTPLGIISTLDIAELLTR